MICNYCKGKEYDIIAKYTRFERNNILRCKKCGLVHLYIKKDRNDIESLYASEYRKNLALPIQSAQEHYSDKVTQYDSENRILFIKENIDITNKKFLEIGSASGSLLDKLLEYEAKEVIGIELDKEYAEFSQNKGFNVFTKTIEKLNFCEEFDAIVTFHTLEHIFDPMSTIKAVYKALKTDGIFLGEVPNQNDWRIKIFDNEIAKRFHYDPNHYYYFSPEILNGYLKMCGFDKIKLQTVERYNSLTQLRNILCNKNTEKNIEDTLKKYIFPKNEKDELRLPYVNSLVEKEFNRIFENAVNSELMGNCIRFVTYKKYYHIME